MIKSCVVFFLVLLFLIIPLTGAAASEDENEVVIIRIDTDVEGNTSRFFLLNELRIREGKTYKSYVDLAEMMESRVNNLEQRRLFKELSWMIHRPAPGEAIIEIHAVDSFTIYPRPMIKYASDTGLLLGLKLEYFNAWGTLTDQVIEAYWSPNEIKARLDIRNIAVGPFHFDFTFEQFDGAARFGSPEGDVVMEYRNSHSLISILADWQLGRTSQWSYRLEPTALWQYNYRFVTSHPGYDEDMFINQGFAPGFNHGLYTDQVVWIRNFRKGIEFSFMNENTWYLETDRLDSFLETDLYAYLPLSRHLEISGRVGGFYAIDGFRENAGDRLRGVIDYMTYGQYGAFLTAQTAISFNPNARLLEFQLRPFADIGYVYSQEWDQGPDSWEYCAGSTLIFFLKPLPSLIFNIEYGWDFKRNMSEVIIDTTLLL